MARGVSRTSKFFSKGNIKPLASLKTKAATALLQTDGNRGIKRNAAAHAEKKTDKRRSVGAFVKSFPTETAVRIEPAAEMAMTIATAVGVAFTNCKRQVGEKAIIQKGPEEQASNDCQKFLDENRRTLPVEIFRL